MNILVLLKQTFDTEEKVVIKDGVINEDGVEFIINPYDEYAVEEGVQLKEEHGGQVTVLTVGPDRAEDALRTALAMGADKAIHVDDEELFGDEYKISKVIEAVVKRDSYDIIICGYMAVDDGAAQVGPRLAELLDIPQIITATELEIDGTTVNVQKDVEGETEYIEATLPVLITAQQGLNEPRYPSIPGIMKAKKKPLEKLDVDDLDLDVDEIASKSVVVDQYLPPKKEAGRVLDGELRNQVTELVQLLYKEAKVV